MHITSSYNKYYNIIKTLPNDSDYIYPNRVKIITTVNDCRNIGGNIQFGDLAIEHIIVSLRTTNILAHTLNIRWDVQLPNKKFANTWLSLEYDEMTRISARQHFYIYGSHTKTIIWQHAPTPTIIIIIVCFSFNLLTHDKE